MYTEHEMEIQMGKLLRAGVILACTIMLAGGILFVLRHGGEREPWGVFHSEPASLRSISSIWREALSGRARGIVQLSVLVMIATPVMRVVFAVYGFARRKQWLYVAISLTVLGLLAFGLSERN